MYMYFVDEENLKDAKKRGLLHVCTHTHTRGLLSGVSPGEHRVLLWLGGLLPWFDDFLHAPYKAWTLYSSFTKLFSGPGWVGITEAPGKNPGRK